MFKKIEKSALNSHQKAMLKSIYAEILKSLDLGLNINELNDLHNFLRHLILTPNLVGGESIYEQIETSVLNSRQKYLLETLSSEILKALELGLSINELNDSIKFFNANLELKIDGIRLPKVPTVASKASDRLKKAMKKLRENLPE